MSKVGRDILKEKRYKDKESEEEQSIFDMIKQEERKKKDYQKGAIIKHDE